MQRKPSFPVANCNIKMPETGNMSDLGLDDETEHQQKRLQLINFGHSQWGFNNWSWSVSKQDLDFVEFANGRYTAGVVSFVSVTVKSFEIHRENIGYGTAAATGKGLAIHKARKSAVTNALRETLLSFGGSVATELLELLESHKSEVSVSTPAPPEPQIENIQNNQNVANKTAEPKNSPLNKGPRKDEGIAANARSPLVTAPVAPVKNIPTAPVAKAHPIPANLPPAANRPPLAANTPRLAAPTTPAARPNSNPEQGKALENMTEEEARAERKRRQRMAQEEFRMKQMMKTGQGNDEKEKQDLQKSSASFDNLLLDIPSQDVVIEDTNTEAGKRKSPTASGGLGKKRHCSNRLDIVTAD